MKGTLEDILETMPPIPANLRRTPTSENTMTAEQKKTERKQRQKVTLPEIIKWNDQEDTVIADLSIQQLLAAKGARLDFLASVDEKKEKTKLELRAIRKAIIAKA